MRSDSQYRPRLFQRRPPYESWGWWCLVFAIRCCVDCLWELSQRAAWDLSKGELFDAAFWELCDSIYHYQETWPRSVEKWSDPCKLGSECEVSWCEIWVDVKGSAVFGEILHLCRYCSVDVEATLHCLSIFVNALRCGYHFFSASLQSRFLYGFLAVAEELQLASMRVEPRPHAHRRRWRQ